MIMAWKEIFTSFCREFLKMLIVVFYHTMYLPNTFISMNSVGFADTVRKKLTELYPLKDVSAMKKEARFFI